MLITMMYGSSYILGTAYSLEFVVSYDAAGVVVIVVGRGEFGDCVCLFVMFRVLVGFVLLAYSVLVT